MIKNGVMVVLLLIAIIVMGCESESKHQRRRQPNPPQQEQVVENKQPEQVKEKKHIVIKLYSGGIIVEEYQTKEVTKYDDITWKFVDIANNHTMYIRGTVSIKQ